MRCYAACLALVIPFFGCTETVVSEQIEETAVVSVKKESISNLYGSSINHPNPSTNQNAFSTRLFGALNRQFVGGNILVSPFSVEQVLAQVYLGSRGRTENEFGRLLHPEVSKNNYIENYSNHYMAFSREKTNSSSFFRSLGRLWVQKGGPIQKDFLKNAKRYFNAPITPVDFSDVEQRLEAAKAINGWIKRQTNQRIDKILQDDSLSTDTRLVLANASYFEGLWTKPFRAAQTRKKTFFNADGSKSALAMMNQSARFNYSSDGGVQYIELEYKKAKETGSSFAMEIYLADRSKPLSWLVEKVTGDARMDLQKKASPTLVSLTLPKWTASTPTYRLKKTLISGGLECAFKPFQTAKEGVTANFSGINGKRDLYLSEVLHKSYIKVDEAGTEAAAATVGMVFGVTAVQPSAKTTTFVADHSFVYVIREKASGKDLFIGQVAVL